MMTRSWPMKRNEVLAVAAVTVWLTIVGCEIWFHAASATEPPVWDALSYSMKSKAFWDAVGSGHAFNPFALEPTVRPPGVVLVSYPFGFSERFSGFYFRTNFIPALLLALSVLIVGWATRTIRNSPFVVAGVSVCVAGLPMIFQFQAFRETPGAGAYWGMVDNFITGIAALSAACLVAASVRKSSRWAGLAATLAGFCLWIKPAGLLIMACMLFSFSCLLGPEFWRKRRPDAWVVKSLAAFLIAYAVAGSAAFFSPYFSMANVEYGSRSIVILKSEYPWTFSLSLLAGTLQRGPGSAVTAILVLGLASAAMSRKHRWALPAACVTLASGIWFWLFFTGAVENVRYFVPFALMAAVFVLPAAMDWMARRGALAQGMLVCFLSLPALASTVLAAQLSASASYQRSLGISLSSNAFAGEGRLATYVIEDAQRRRIKRPRIYACVLTDPLRVFSAVIEYGRNIGNAATKGTISVPDDWTRGAAFRLDEILQVDYIACVAKEGVRPVSVAQVGEEPLRWKHSIDSPGRGGGGGEPTQVATYQDEYRVVRDWLQTLGSESGVEAVSTEHMVLLHIVDRRRFEMALADFASRYRWRQIAADGYSSRWWSESELKGESERSSVGTLNIEFRDANQKLVQTLKGLRVAMGDRDATVDIWLQPGPDPDLIAMEGFRLFCHLESAEGAIVAHSEARISQITRTGQLRQYRLVIANAARSKGGRFGIGVYGPDLSGATDSVLLRADASGMDSGGRRFPFPAAPFPSGSAVFGNSPGA